MSMSGSKDIMVKIFKIFCVCKWIQSIYQTRWNLLFFRAVAAIWRNI